MTGVSVRQYGQTWIKRADAQNGKTHRYYLIRIGHHGDEHVEQNNDVDHGVRTEQQQAPKPRETLDPGEIERRQIHETETGPEERLRRFEYAATCHENISL